MSNELFKKSYYTKIKRLVFLSSSLLVIAMNYGISHHKLKDKEDAKKIIELIKKLVTTI